jgi:hypothetical protein
VPQATAALPTGIGVPLSTAGHRCRVLALGSADGVAQAVHLIRIGRPAVHHDLVGAQVTARAGEPADRGRGGQQTGGGVGRVVARA